MKKDNQTNKKSNLTKKSVSKAKKIAKEKQKKLAIAVICIVLIIIIAVIIMFVIKPAYWDAFKGAFNRYNTTKDVPGITAIEGDKLEMQVIDVGQGDSIFFTFPDGKTMLVDIGSEFRTPSCWTAVDNVLKENDVTVLDYVFITHTDYDHVRELEKLCVNYEVKNLYLPKVKAVMSNTWNDVYNMLLTPTAENYFQEKYRDENGKMQPATINYNLGSYEIAGEGWLMKCYSFTGEEDFYKKMADGSSAERKNSISPICILEYGGRSICLTGDANEQTEEYILSQGYLDDVDVDVLKVGHHGSKGSTTQGFLDKIDPEFAIISNSATNTYNHPHDELMTRLKDYNDVKKDDDYNGFGDKDSYRIYRTDQDGTCTVQIGANGILNVISSKQGDKNRTITVVAFVFENNNICEMRIAKFDNAQVKCQVA